ncbi:MAG: AAA family ATPase [Nannocystales bacterium]
MEVRLSVFSRVSGRRVHWTTVGVGPFCTTVSASSAAKARQRLMDGVRKRVAKLFPHELEPLETVRGRRLHLVRLDLSMRNGGARSRFYGTVPIVVEPRTRGGAVPGPILVAYHPLRPGAWFVHEEERELADEAKAFFQVDWADLPEDELSSLESEKKDKLELVAFSISPKPLEAKLEKKKDKPPALLGGGSGPTGEALLTRLGSCATMHVVDGVADPVIARAPYRDTLAQLACGRQKKSVLLVGPSGAGKSCLLQQLVVDLLSADDYPSHRNLDKIHKVWKVRGQRVIAGMSYLGQWEERCVNIVEACRKHRGVLWIEDIAGWGRIGQTRGSDRALATFFRGPMMRNELMAFAECSPEGLAQLQDEAPGFAAAFTTVFVEPTERDETLRMLVQEARRYERERGVAFDPLIFRMLHDLGGSLGGAGAQPGKALDLLRQLATGDSQGPLNLREADDALKLGKKILAIKAYRAKVGCGLREAKTAVEARMATGHWGPTPKRASSRPEVARSLLDEQSEGSTRRPDIGAQEVIGHLSGRTGMPAVLLDAKRPLDPESVSRQLRSQIMGQEAAVAAMRDVVVRIKAGLCDPSRPFGVFLFTGPTGTGKTEMAKCLADYLYGTTARLLRFDMSEYGTPDAPSRLIGDRFNPEGTLTAKVRAQPFSVVLLDEIEKADPSVLNLMLQLFDDGRLTDAAGQRVDFTHTIVIMTSNLGAKKTPSVGFGGEDADISDVGAAVRAFFPPELFNRIDHVVEYGPLGREAASSIARRELDKLVSRRGLVDRNVFVRYTPSVVARVVREGFAAKDGARSLKRYLESNVGSLLADSLAASEASAMRMLWLFEREGALRLHSETLAEAEAFGSSSPLEAALAFSGKQLRAEVPEALARAEALTDSDALARLSDTLSDEVARQSAEGQSDAADLEALRAEVRGLADDLRMQLEYDPMLAASRPLDERADYEGEIVEHESFATEARTEPFGGGGIEVQVRVLGRQPGPSLPLQGRQDFLRTLGTLRFLERAVERGADPSAHVVLIELTRVSGVHRASRFGESSQGLFDWLLQAYRAGRGDVEASLIIDDAGRRYSHPEAVVSGPRRALLRIVGPGAQAFYGPEEGSHVRDSVSGGTEVVRVRALPGYGVELEEHLDRLEAGREAFSTAIETADSPPANPDGLLPIVRRYAFDPPTPGALAWIDVEDYPLMYAYRGRSASLREALDTVWLLRMGASMNAKEQD